MRGEIKAQRDRNKGGRKQTGHETLRPARDGTRPVEKEESNQGKAPKNNVRADHPLKIMRQTLEGVRQRMPASVNDCPTPELVEGTGLPKDEAGQCIRHNGSKRKGGHLP